MKALITGGCGFVGSNVAARLLDFDSDVCVFDNLARAGSSQNLEWLRSLGLKTFIEGDVRLEAHVTAALQKLKPTAIFHFAGQVAMTTSVADPRRDFETNVLGAFNVLEGARRHSPAAAIIFASSNKVYGDLNDLNLREDDLRYVAPDRPAGIDETARLDFQTPYGCSKGAADQYMLDYARMYGLNTVVFRHSTIYGARQFATADQGWVGWFCHQALEAKRDPARDAFTISGNGKQVRDLLFVDDVVNCYLAAVHHIDRARGQAFNIGGGMTNSSSLLELFAFLEQKLRVKLVYKQLPCRPFDQLFFVADITKARTLLHWQPSVSREDGLASMIEWTKKLQ